MAQDQVVPFNNAQDIDEILVEEENPIPSHLCILCHGHHQNVFEILARCTVPGCLERYCFICFTNERSLGNWSQNSEFYCELHSIQFFTTCNKCHKFCKISESDRISNTQFLCTHCSLMHHFQKSCTCFCCTARCNECGIKAKYVSKQNNMGWCAAHYTPNESNGKIYNMKKWEKCTRCSMRVLPCRMSPVSCYFCSQSAFAVHYRML